MTRYFKLLFFVLVFASFSLKAQQISKQTYIDNWKDVAMLQMQRHKIPASIILAQGILESGFGNSRLAKEGNNHFGIKCHDWKGEKIYHDDDEKGECFRKYADARQSFEDHSIFLTSRGRYASLFELTITDYKAWAKGLKDAGYATNPKYPQLLTDIIETHKLYIFDEMALGKGPSDAVIADKGSTKKSESRKQKKPVEKTIVLGDEFETFTINKRVKYIVVEKGNTFYSISNAFDLSELQLRLYNDMHSKSVLKAGERLFVSPKRNKSVDQDFHIVKSGETMRDIGQLYGVKTKSLYRKNRMVSGTDPEVNQKIYLRKKMPKS